MSLGSIFDIAGSGMTAQSLRLNTTASKVVLAWQWRAHGFVVNPEASRLDYQQENLDFFDVKLSDADVATLDEW